MPSDWRPLLSGTAAAPYQQAVEAILEAIDGQAVDPFDWGRPLLHTYLALGGSSLTDRGRATASIDNTIDALAQGTRPLSLYHGVAGVGWLAAHADALFESRDDAAYTEVDEALLCAPSPDLTPFAYDLINGVVGVGVYYLERLPHPRAIEGLRRVVAALEHHAEDRRDGVTWHTAPSLLPNWQRARAPDGYYNMGVAHGVPGVIGFLSELCLAGVSIRGAEELLARAIRWVLNELTANDRFPSWIARTIDRRGKLATPVAWCYGPLGVSIPLLVGARVLGDRDVGRAAVDLALQSAKRREVNRVMGTGLCHGSAGNAHLFNRLYQATGHGEFREAAAFWLEVTLRMRIHAPGVAGFRTWTRRTEAGEYGWQDDSSFLTGASGIALALAAATTDIPPDWDRVMLASIEPLHQA